jgi:hypothetical protein
MFHSSLQLKFSRSRHDCDIVRMEDADFPIQILVTPRPLRASVTKQLGISAFINKHDAIDLVYQDWTCDIFLHPNLSESNESR